MPWVRQNEGTMQQAQRRASPTFIVIGMYWSTNTTTTKRPPATKCRNNVQIYALMSEVKMKDVTYVNGTIAGGKRRNRI